MEAVLFDFDGTLADTREADLLAFGRASRSLGIAEDLSLRFGDFEGMPLLQRMMAVAPDRGGELLQRMLAYQEPVRLFNGIRMALRSLMERHIPLALVSSRRSLSLRRELGLLGLTRIFDAIVGLDQVEHPKPDPEALLQAAKLLRLTPGTCHYVGDTAVDMAAAAAAGMPFVLAQWGARAGLTAPLVARTPADLVDLVIQAHDGR